jgi:hypothetical protein
MDYPINLRMRNAGAMFGSACHIEHAAYDTQAIEFI